MAILQRTLTRGAARSTASVRLGPVLLGAAAVIVAIGVVQLMLTSRATTASFKIQQLQQEKLELETSVRQLEADVAALSSLARIEQEARRLGLVPAERVEVVQVNVPPPLDEETGLPTRFLPEEDRSAGVGEQGGSSWWRDLLKLLPFQ